MSSHAEILNAALVYAARDWAVFPCHTVNQRGVCSCQKGDKCKTPGKHPRTPHGLTDATTDPATIRQWWTQWPDANVAILGGRESGLWVLDIDPRHGGNETLAALEADHGPLPETVESQTGGGGRHLLFRHPGDRRIKNDGAGKLIGPGLDVRGDDGYIIGPPSQHKSGRTYCWELSSTPDSMPLADAPDWLLAMVREPDVLPAKTNDTESERAGETEKRSNCSVSPSLCLSVSALPAEVIQAIDATSPKMPGQRNCAIFEFVRAMKAVYPDADARPLEPAVQAWHAKALPNIDTKDFDDTWGDFLYGWDRVKFPRGTGLLHELLARADAADLPAGAERYGEATRRLVKFCRELQSGVGDAPFYLAYSSISDLLGIDRNAASRRLRVLVADGVLTVAQAHTAIRATRYRYCGFGQGQTKR
ncbi:MAG: bifunctional DNA primase/polymerase [Phycisphaerae bacterium]|nr:bifunctional DNA primase/polymerase [Phycisphaerae bacterium]